MSVSLRIQIVNGLAWSLFGKLVTQIFAWISTFLVVRLLSPDDYGVMAVLMVFFSFIAIIANDGLVRALVCYESMGEHGRRMIFSLSVLLNLIMSFLMVALSPLLAKWYESQDLMYCIWGLAAVTPLSSLGVVPQAHLQQELRFKEKAVVESVSGLFSAVVALVMAYLGAGVWALVLATMAMMLTRVAGMCYVAKVRFGFTGDFTGGQSLLAYAWHTQLGNVVWFLYTRADAILIGKLLGMEKVGVYSVASDIASLPMAKVNAVIGEVSFAVFSKEREQARLYLKKAMRMMSVITFPVFYGIASISHEVVQLILGEQWAGAAPIIAILCLIMPLRMLSSVMHNFASGIGEAKFCLHNGMVVAVIMIISVAIGASYGVIETAWGWVIGFSIAYIWQMYRYASYLAVQLKEQFEFVSPALISAIMSVLLWWVTPWLSSSFESLLGLMLIKIAIGVFIAAPCLMILYGAEIKAILRREA